MSAAAASAKLPPTEFLIIHSARRSERPFKPRSKPAPDVYLAAAAALGVDPRRCAVVEDTVTGATAGVAAGATVFGYSPPEAGHDTPVALRQAGVVEVFANMADLPTLLRQASGAV